MSMTRVKVDGHTLNRRTAKMLKCAEGRLGFSLDIMQGSYNSSVPQSGGTHDGGGAVDVGATSNPSEVVRRLREVGFAAWHRLPSQGDWPEHIHAIAIGDAEMSSGAHSQVVAYYAGRNGLFSNLPDDGPRLSPIPVWPINIPEISLSRATNQFKTEHKRKVLAVERIQKLLNRRINADLLVDGIAGEFTTAAYLKWEKRFDDAAQDGIPGIYTLRQLVAGYYKVVK